MANHIGFNTYATIDHIFVQSDETHMIQSSDMHAKIWKQKQ